MKLLRLTLAAAALAALAAACDPGTSTGPSPARPPLHDAVSGNGNGTASPSEAPPPPPIPPDTTDRGGQTVGSGG